MQLLTEDLRIELAKRLEAVEKPLRILVFSEPVTGIYVPGRRECVSCKQAEDLMQEVADLSDNLSLEIYNIKENQQMAKDWGIEHTPTISLVADEDVGIRFIGLPNGYEFGSFFETILSFSKKDFGLSEEVAARVAGVTEQIEIKTFSTPTCPHCPRAIVNAHRMALANPLITSTAVESQEFSELAGQYDVYSVPKIVVNETHHFVGGLPEPEFVEAVLEGAGR